MKERESWSAAVRGVAKSQTSEQLNNKSPGSLVLEESLLHLGPQRWRSVRGKGGILGTILLLSGHIICVNLMKTAKGREIAYLVGNLELIIAKSKKLKKNLK